MDKWEIRFKQAKIKIMSFHGKYSVWWKIILNVAPKERVTNFKYLECKVIYNATERVPIFHQIYGKKINKWPI